VRVGEGGPNVRGQPPVHVQQQAQARNSMRAAAHEQQVRVLVLSSSMRATTREQRVQGCSIMRSTPYVGQRPDASNRER
jgi:hypothetical protein